MMKWILLIGLLFCSGCKLIFFVNYQQAGDAYGLPDSVIKTEVRIEEDFHDR
jgi:hypothetical protein